MKSSISAVPANPMNDVESDVLLRPGDRAPDFTLPAATHEGLISFSEYRGRSPVFLALFRGLYCPFCRHHIARLGLRAAKLQAVGVATIGVVATAADRARLYFRFHLPRVPMGADPDLATHRAYRLPRMAITKTIEEAIEVADVRFAHELGVDVAPGQAWKTVEKLDGYQPTEGDKDESARHQAQMIGQFLVDRSGIIQWANVEGARRPRGPQPVPDRRGDTGRCARDPSGHPAYALRDPDHAVRLIRGIRAFIVAATSVVSRSV